MVRGSATVAEVAAGCFFLLAGVLFAVALTDRPGTPFATAAMAAAQLGVLCFYWVPYRTVWGSSSSGVVRVLGAVCLVVSLCILWVAGGFLIANKTPFLQWGPFLLVHLLANIALGVRPRVYLWWILGVWTVGPLAMGAFVLFNLTHPGGFELINGLLTALVGPMGARDYQSIVPGVFWLISLDVFIGTAAGAGFARLWMRRLHRKESRKSWRNARSWPRTGV